MLCLNAGVYKFLEFFARQIKRTLRFCYFGIISIFTGV